MTETYEEKNVNPNVSSDSQFESKGSGGPREGVEEFTEEARRKGKGFFEEQKRTAAESLGRIAEVLHDTHSRLEWEQPSAARLFGQGADVLERAADNLQRHDAEALFQQMREFARRQPGLMLGGAVAAGFVMTRMFKSTSHRPETEYGSQGDFFEKAKGSAEKAKESAQSFFEEKDVEKESDESGSGIILSPNEPLREDMSKKPPIQKDVSQTTILTEEEERHATE